MGEPRLSAVQDRTWTPRRALLLAQGPFELSLLPPPRHGKTDSVHGRQVTTSVSNFLLGNPIIDHYGDMVITNHRTGETCTLTFKPRGWRGGNASEIKGDVKDAEGRKCWDIAGKWSSQLVARRVGAGHGELAPDATIPTDHAGEVVPEYIRLWKNSEKPPNTPFGLYV